MRAAVATQVAHENGSSGQVTASRAGAHRLDGNFTRLEAARSGAGRGFFGHFGLAVGSSLMLVACGGTEGQPTPGPDTELAITFGSLADGAQVSQTATLQVGASGGGGVTELVFIAPEDLVGQDDDPDPSRLAASWDTTLEPNGSVTVTATAKGLDGTTVTKSVTLSRANIDAAIQTSYDDLGFVRYGAPLILTASAAPFGATPSLAGIEARAVEGGGLNPALPVRGVSDGAGGFTLNLGSPTSGSVQILLSAVNSAGEYSAPRTLDLEVLRDDVVSGSVFSDFEVTPDGRTGLLLTSVAGSADMRVEFLNLNDPANPARYDVILPLNPGVTSSGTGPIGNLVLNAAGTTAFALFPSSKQVYKIDVASRSTTVSTLITSLPRTESGASLTRLNRQPYAVATPDGNYLATWDNLTPASLVLIRTTDMAQIGNSQGQVVAPYPSPVSTNPSGFGLMAAHPNNRFLYAVNNWGATNTSAADLAVFDLSARAFVDFNTVTPPVKDPYTLENSQSRFKVAQQPAVSPDGTRLVVPICDMSAGGTLVKVFQINGESPTAISLVADVDLSSVSCGSVAGISPSGRFMVIAGNNPNQPQGALIDLSTTGVLSVTFPDGVKDAAFSAESTQIFAESLSYLDRDMAAVDLNSGSYTPQLHVVPSSVGLVPPSSTTKMRYHLLARGGAFLYQVYAAEVLDGQGGSQIKGTSLSVYSIGQKSFVFPNTL